MKKLITIFVVCGLCGNVAAMDLSTSLNMQIKTSASTSASLGATVFSEATAKYSSKFTDGTAANQANSVYFLSGGIGSATEITLDLYGSLSDVFGHSVSMTGVKAMYVGNTSDVVGSTAELYVGGGTGGNGTNAWDTWVTASGADGSEAVRLSPGGSLFATNPTAAGWVVTPNTADVLRVYNASVVAGSYEVMIVGIDTTGS